jgi:hypothetical protein
MSRGGGAVGLTSKGLVAAMLGLPYAREKALMPYASGRRGTGNQRAMGAAAGLFALDLSLRQAATETADRILSEQEAESLSLGEQFCPDPHGGMWLLAAVGMMASDYPELARRAAAVVGRELRVADLVATSKGDCRGLPGLRAPMGAKLGRRALSHLRIEIRMRQPGGSGLVHRGTGGRPQDIKWDEDSDPLIVGPAWWMRQLLDGPSGEELLAGPLSREGLLPHYLRLPLTVYRWNGGTLATLADPGPPEKREEFSVRGSAAAKRDPSRQEKPVTWIRVLEAGSGRLTVTAGQSWESEPPTPPIDAKVTTVPEGRP